MGETTQGEHVPGRTHPCEAKVEIEVPMNIMMMKRGVYNAVSFQAKCRSTRFYSSSSLGANERWKEDLRSELDSFQYHYQYQSEHYMFGTLMSTSTQFIIYILM